MIKERITINGIYKHYKGDFYRVTEVAYHHQDGAELAIVLYHKCDENGMFKSIRLSVPSFDNEENKAIIIGQPFWRLLDDFIGEAQVGIRDIKQKVKRFEFIKEVL